jgi:membrane-associated phospholipid phosphatase
MVGLAGIFMFVISLSIFFSLNLVFSIVFLIIALGLTATSRLYFKAHTGAEIVLGFFVGLLPQLIVLNYWL